MEEKVKETPKRDQVLALLQDPTVKYTREELAIKLQTTVASISSQFTYLRWMGNFIIFDENKKLSLVSQAEYEAWAAARSAKAGKKATATRSPEAQAVALAKTVAGQEKQLATWAAKLEQVVKDLVAEPVNETLLELQTEARANVDLLTIKIKRNKAKLLELPEPSEPADTDPEYNDAIDADGPPDDEYVDDGDDIV